MTLSHTLKTRLFDVQANIIAIHPLLGIGTEHVPDWMEEVCEHIAEASGERKISWLNSLPELRYIFEGDTFPDEDSLHEALFMSDSSGFIVEADWEVRSYNNDGCSFYSGPGRRRIFWFYADTIEACFEAVIAAAEADHQRQKAKVDAK